MTERLKLSDVKPGDVLAADNGFTCIAPGAKLTVSDRGGYLAVPCKAGNHSLGGQTDSKGYLIGLTRWSQSS